MVVGYKGEASRQNGSAIIAHWSASCMQLIRHRVNYKYMFKMQKDFSWFPKESSLYGFWRIKGW